MDFKFVFDLDLLKVLSPKSKNAHFFILGSKFFEGLNHKSATISMYKIHIYIDSETFRQRMSRLFGE